MKKRIGSALLALVMLLSLFPLPALAYEGDFYPVAEGFEEDDFLSGNDELNGGFVTVSAEEEVYIPDEDILPDSDELFAGYVERLLYSDLIPDSMLFGVSAGDKFTGKNQLLYNKLKAKIEAVADGTETSTAFEIPLEELGLKETYTLVDLGISAGLSQEETGNQIAAKIKEIFTFDYTAVVQALMVDCPYELYWYDKTTGYTCYSEGPSLSSQYAIQTSDNTVASATTTISFNDATGLPVSFAVAGAYGSNYQITASVGVGSAVEKAKQNAQKVVDDNANESDYQKLLAYKKYICDKVSYNDDAAKNDYSGGYGDPWQLIHVFDEDSDTKVVCEGYSKAFKYLCDLSAFRGDVSCYIVTGTMSGGTGAGRHMWNHVQIGGKVYLVDVTNCDGDESTSKVSIGYPDKLFMVGEKSTVANQYSFKIGSETITYVFDADADQWGADVGVLKLAEENYEEESDTPDPKPDTPITLTADMVTVEGATVGADGSWSVTYDGNEHPVVVKDGSKTLTENTDYEVTYNGGTAKPQNAATYQVVITGKGNYTGTASTKFTVNKAKPTVVKVDGDVYPATTPDSVSLTGTAVLNNAAGQKVKDVRGDFTAVSISPQPLTVGQEATIQWKFTPSGTDAGNFEEVTGEVKVTVKKSDVVSIAITTQPTNKAKEYTYGEAFELDGLVLTVQKTDGTETVTYAANSGITFSPARFDTVGDSVTVTVSYGGESVDIAGIKVAPKALTIKASDQTIEYGEEISKTVNDVVSTGLVNGDEVTGITLAASTTAVGSGTITPSAATIENNNGENVAGNYTINYDNYDPGKLTITKAKLTAEGTGIAKGTYGQKLSELTVEGLTAKRKGAEIKGTWALTDDTVPNVGDSNEYTATFTPATGAGNYETLTDTVKLEIEKAAYTGTTTANSSAKFGASGTCDLTLLLPDGAKLGTVSVTDDKKIFADPAPAVEGSVLSYTLADDSTKADKTADVKVTVSSTNYNDFQLTITVTVSSKSVPVLTIDAISVTYSGKALTDSDIKGTAKAGSTTVPGKWSFAAGQGLTNVAESGRKTVKFVPDDGENYDEVESFVLVTISKATPTGAPKYAAISTSGKTLADASLTTEGGTFSVPGTVAWVLPDTTEVEANQDYQWTFTPTDSANYNTLSDTIRLWRSTNSGTGTGTNSGSGSSGGYYDPLPYYPSYPSAPSAPSSPSTPVSSGAVNQDGGYAMATTASPSATVQGVTATAVLNTTLGNEIVSQAISNRSENVVIAPTVSGSVSRTEVSIPSSTVARIGNQTSANLTVSTPVADVTIPNGGLSSLSSAGGNVTVTADRVGNTVELSVKAGGQTVSEVPGGVTLTVPMTGATSGTVAMLVRQDGTREIVRKSVADANGLTVPLDGSAQLVIMDNTKYFVDVPATSWAADAVAFASSHELFNGTGINQFSPDQPMSRGMLAVVLHNLESNPAQPVTGAFGDVSSREWYAEGISWAAARGIVSGYGNGQFGPNDSITREQLAVMLWRYDGSPAASSGSLSFNDAYKASDWAQSALCWAVGRGVLNGKGGGILDPGGYATRAETAQMLKNFMESQ